MARWNSGGGTKALIDRRSGGATATCTTSRYAGPAYQVEPRHWRVATGTLTWNAVSKRAGGTAYWITCCEAKYGACTKNQRG